MERVTPRKKRGRPPRIVKVTNNIEKLHSVPCLELTVEHLGKDHHSPVSGENEVYKYKTPCGNSVLLKNNYEQACTLQSSGDYILERDGKVIKVKKSKVDFYRKTSKYYGPLRIVLEKFKVNIDGVENDLNQTKLQHVDLSITDQEGNAISPHKMMELYSNMPDIIPPCNITSERESFLIDGKTFQVSALAVATFKNMSGYSEPLVGQIKEDFKTNSHGKNIPVSIITLVPIVPKTSVKKINLAQPVMSHDISEKEAKVENFETSQFKVSFKQNYQNWSHRGDSAFKQMKKVGFDFLNDIIDTNYELKDSLDIFGNSFSSDSNEERVVSEEINLNSSSFITNSEDWGNEIWNYITDQAIIKSLLYNKFETENKVFFEIKRVLNNFSVNGEVLPDVVVKFSMETIKPVLIYYYVRCFSSRLIKSGKVLSMSHVDWLLKLFSKEFYPCIGINKDKYLFQIDQNEEMRRYLRENGKLVLLPFECLYDRNCKAIVRQNSSLKTVNFQRGLTTINGRKIICKLCMELEIKLEELSDSYLRLPRTEKNNEDCSSIPPHYGPVLKVNENIRKLFLETPVEFISNSRNENMILSSGKKGEGDNLDRTKANIVTSEDEFINMIRIDPGVNGMKHCNECGFKNQSSLSLMNHMEDHLGSLSAKCDKCHLKFSNLAALERHTLINHNKMGTVCPICREEFSSTQFMFIHMNIHRKCKPYQCPKCSEQFQSFNKYKKHLKQSHGYSTMKDINIVCHFCHSFYYTLDDLLIHRVNENHNCEEGYMCRICGVLSSTNKIFISHLLNHSWQEREDNNLAICLRCKKIFFSVFILKFHLATKHNEYLSLDSSILISSDTKEEVEYECQICQVVLSKESFVKHIETQHTNYHNVDSEELNDRSADPSSQNLSRLLPLSCNICGRRFLRGFALSNHMKIHDSDKPIFECEECGFMYEKRNQVLDHIHKDHSDTLQKHLEHQELNSCKKFKIENSEMPMNSQIRESLHDINDTVKAPVSSATDTTFLQQNGATQEGHRDQVISVSNVEWNTSRVQNVASGCQTDAMYNLLSLTDF